MAPPAIDIERITRTRPELAAVARRLAEALEGLRDDDTDLGLARGLAWTLTDLLDHHGALGGRR